MKKYATPKAFKDALEQRIRQQFPAHIARARQLLIYTRFMARINEVLGEQATLKGGLALELRLAQARSTKDIDLGLHDTSSDSASILHKLQHAARLDLGDFLIFQVIPDEAHPEIQNEGMRYDGFRFRGSCQLDGREYGSRSFGIDVALGDPVLRDAEELVTHDWLGFAGIPPTTVRAYRVETHIAEKLHAYTMPRQRANSRLKDLPDLALLAQTPRELGRPALRDAIHATFRARNTHEPPPAVPAPPPAWAAEYPAFAKTEALPWTTLDELFSRVRDFLAPVLTTSEEDARWDRAAWRWVAT